MWTGMGSREDQEDEVVRLRGSDDRHGVIVPAKSGGNGLDLQLPMEEDLTMRTSEENQIAFCWENLTIEAPAKGQSVNNCCKRSSDQPTEHKIILRNASGFVRPGELLAIMGASGAGKSTLLNALTFRNLSGLNVISGARYANGVKISPNSLTSVSAYVQQDDLFIGTLTVREHLIFQALVRMDREVSVKNRMIMVDSVITELGLSKCAKTLIGVPGRIKGISGGEMKRLSFASEVLTNPPLLFCDEPTSGLDSYMAQNVVEVMRNLARKGKTVVATIHQPSSQVFDMFDRLLLMAEGRVAFMGGMKEAVEFFAKLNYPCPLNYNPADHFVHVLAVIPGKEQACKERINMICDNFDTSKEGGKACQEFVEYQKTNVRAIQSLNDSSKFKSPYKATWWEQFKALLWRSCWRS